MAKKSPAIGAYVTEVVEEAEACCAEPQLPPVGGSLTADERTARARELYGSGRERFDVGDYTEAAHLFELAYAHAPEQHALAYNIGLAYSRMGECCRAEAFFRKFATSAGLELESDLDIVEKQLAGLEAAGCSLCVD